jgi:hypothetical protein
MVPQEDISTIEKALESQGILCKDFNSGDSLELYQCECTDEQLANVQPFEFKVGQKSVDLQPSSFLKKKGDKCTLLMYPSD